MDECVCFPVHPPLRLLQSEHLLKQFQCCGSKKRTKNVFLSASKANRLFVARLIMLSKADAKEFELAQIDPDPIPFEEPTLTHKLLTDDMVFKIRAKHVWRNLETGMKRLSK